MSLINTVGAGRLNFRRKTRTADEFLMNWEILSTALLMRLKAVVEFLCIISSKKVATTSVLYLFSIRSKFYSIKL